MVFAYAFRWHFTWSINESGDSIDSRYAQQHAQPRNIGKLLPNDDVAYDIACFRLNKCKFRLSLISCRTHRARQTFFCHKFRDKKSCWKLSWNSFVKFMLRWFASFALDNRTDSATCSTNISRFPVPFQFCHSLLREFWALLQFAQLLLLVIYLKQKFNTQIKWT